MLSVSWLKTLLFSDSFQERKLYMRHTANYSSPPYVCRAWIMHCALTTFMEIISNTPEGRWICACTCTPNIVVWSICVSLAHFRCNARWRIGLENWWFSSLSLSPNTADSTSSTRLPNNENGHTNLWSQNEMVTMRVASKYSFRKSFSVNIDDKNGSAADSKRSAPMRR